MISVIMPVYNPGSHLQAAVSSIISQTHSDFELIAVNDGSTDASEAFLRDVSLRDRRVRTLNISHGGEARALNAGIAEAKGEMVAFMDHDDVALPNRLAVQLDWMMKTKTEVCGTQARTFGDSRKLMWFPERHEAILRELVFRMALIKTSVMMRADIARKHPWDETTPACEYCQWLELALRYRLGSVPMVLMKYRRHPGQFSKKSLPQIGEGMKDPRKSFFFSLFPGAGTDDYAAMSRVAEYRPMENADSLRLAGKWLLKMAEVDDAFLQNRMARRWLGTCMKSACLGMKCHRIYREILPSFNVPSPKNMWRLHLKCALKTFLFHRQ